MLYALILLGTLGGASPALAQTDPPVLETSTVFETSTVLEPSTVSETSTTSTFQDDLTVTATLEATPAADAPASVSVFDQADIEARQATTVIDLLRTVPGVTVAQSGGPGTVTSVFSRGTNSTHTLALWNGVPLNSPYFGGYDWAFLPTVGVDRIEVVRGPLSSLYGSDAIGGTVNILSGRHNGITLDLEGGDNSYGRAAITAGHSFSTGDSGALRLDVLGLARTSEGELNNDFYDGEDITARLEWNSATSAENAFSIGLLARVHDAEIGIPRSGATLTPNRLQTQQDRQLAVPIHAGFGAWEVDVLLSRIDSDFEFRDPDAFFDANDTDAESLRGRAVATVHFDRDTANSGGGASWLAFGGEWRREEVTNINTFGVNLDDDRQTSRAAFSQLHWQQDRWLIDLSLRHDDHESFGGPSSYQTSPGVHVAYQLSEGTRLRAGWSQAFRAPSLGERFFPFSGNPNLQPETSDNYEVALEHRSGPWQFGLAVFDIRQDGLIDFDPVTFTNVNRGRAESQGLEAELSWTRNGFSVQFGATLLDAENLDTGEALLRRPDESAFAVVTWVPSAWKPSARKTSTGNSASNLARWTFHLEATFTGERPDSDPVTFARTTNPSHTRIDLGARWQVTSVLAPYARIENVVDEEYEEVLGFPALGRTVIGGIALRW